MAEQDAACGRRGTGTWSFITAVAAKWRLDEEGIGHPHKKDDDGATVWTVAMRRCKWGFLSARIVCRVLCAEYQEGRGLAGFRTRRSCASGQKAEVGCVIRGAQPVCVDGRRDCFCNESGQERLYIPLRRDSVSGRYMQTTYSYLRILSATVPFLVIPGVHGRSGGKRVTCDIGSI